MLENYSSKLLIPKIRKDLPNFFGYQFEKFITYWVQWQCIKKDMDFPYDTVGKYWDRGQNEIDVVAHRYDGDLCLIGKCKLNSKRITSAVAEKLIHQIDVIKKIRGV